MEQEGEEAAFFFFDFFFFHKPTAHRGLVCKIVLHLSGISGVSIFTLLPAHCACFAK